MDRDVLQSRTLRRITVRYSFAVGLIALLALSTYLYNQFIHRKKIQDYEAINLSGRQRMLSQRIALLSLNGKGPEYKKAIDEFQAGLLFLKKTRFVTNDYPEILTLYNGIEDDFKKLVSLKDKKQLFEASQIILRKFDQATLLTQQISETEFRQSSRLAGIFLGSTLMLLLLEIFFIFRPMSKEVKHTFKKLNELEDQSVDSSRLALIGHTAATIGHEIKNPLFAILAYSRSSGDNDEIKLKKINSNAERIKKIIDALSIQARESSRDEKVSSSIKLIIDDAVDVMEPSLKASQITLKRIDNYIGEIFCRPAAISQVVSNILANAIDALKNSKRKEITIETGCSSDYLFVRISDTGPGVPPDLRDKIFKTFMTTKKQGVGSGLGLSFCRKIMREHEGELELRSDISPSCFEMRFPLNLSVRV